VDRRPLHDHAETSSILSSGASLGRSTSLPFSKPAPQRVVDKPFLMPVEDVFAITGRGRTVAIVASCRLSAPDPGKDHDDRLSSFHSRGGEVNVAAW
jgi:hypothetical protein